MAPLLIGVALLAGLALAVVALYNQLAQLGVQADGAWADIEVQLKRRHDLVPNLVATVQGYAGHEQKTLQAVVEARNAAIQAKAPGQQQQAERQLSASLGQLFASAECAPLLQRGCPRSQYGYRAISIQHGSQPGGISAPFLF